MRRIPLRPTSAALALGLALTGVACEEDKRQEGDACVADGDCATAYCLLDTCTRLDADLDGDGVTNALEVMLQLDPGSADTDGDGEADGRELGPAGKAGGQAFDCDGDGVIDALERQVHTDTHGGDADGDGVAAEWDADETTPLCTDQQIVEATSETDSGCRTYGCRPKTHCELKAESPRDDVRDHCVAGPTSDRDETCDGIDDDCDGRVDEECDLTCDGVDDDCDGRPDDDFGVPDCGRPGRTCTEADEALAARWACTPVAPDEAACVGRQVCADGRITCAISRISATDRSCDGVDDDCAGGVDEDYLPQVCGFGVCRAETSCEAGLQVCPSEGEVRVDDEAACDGLDNDCDGLTDEGFDPDAAEPCHAGACSAPPRCTRAGLECPPPPAGTPARDITCDGVDDDCDGEPDDDWPGDGPVPTCGDAACPGHAARCTDGREACAPNQETGADLRDHPEAPALDIVTALITRDGPELTIELSFDGDVPTGDPGPDDPSYTVCFDNAEGGDATGCDMKVVRRWAGIWTCDGERWVDDAWAPADDVEVGCDTDLEELTMILALSDLQPACGAAHISTALDGDRVDDMATPVDLP